MALDISREYKTVGMIKSRLKWQAKFGFKNKKYPLTIDSEGGKLADPSCDHVQCPTGIIAHVGQFCLVHKKVAFIGDDEILLPINIDLHIVFQPKHLK